MNKYGQIFKDNGPLVSSRYWSDTDRTDTDIHYQHREKAECALVATSSYYGGDVFEFGAHDANTARNLLTALDISGIAKQYKDIRFYFFDAFGKFPADMGELTGYFKPYSNQGDQINRHEAYFDEHGLFRDKIQLVQGLFADTCTKEWKDKWRNDKPIIEDHSQTALHLSAEHRNSATRQIGFASIDCNVPSSYKTVFEWLFDALAPNSYIYMDEGLQSPEVMRMWEQFQHALFEKRNIDTHYIRNAGGFGSLWRLYPIVEGKLDL